MGPSYTRGHVQNDALNKGPCPYVCCSGFMLYLEAGSMSHVSSRTDLLAEEYINHFIHEPGEDVSPCSSHVNVRHVVSTR